jgi:four helix bundle protein
MRRAAVSISSNIAEGCSRGSKPDFRRFIEIATGTAFELVSQARIARGQEFLAPAGHDRIYQAALEIIRMLTGLRTSLRD